MNYKRQFLTFQSLIFLVTGLMFTPGVHAAVLVSGSFGKNIPFGPFLPNEAIEVVATITNESPDQTITICEGLCIGDALTFAVGGFASAPTGYTFDFGNVPGGSVFDGQTTDSILPGEQKDFIFGIFSPTEPAALGLHGFSTSLQFFEATTDRPKINQADFFGNWEVVSSVPIPATLPLMLTGLVGLGLFGYRRQAVNTSYL